MSVTTVLVPVLEPEAEALFEGGEAAARALAGLVDRARPLRARVARVDAMREELHDLLYPRWQGGHKRPGQAFSRILSAFRKVAPATASTGYDPFVQLFGRSLPVEAATPRQVAEALVQLVAADETTFEATLGAQLDTLDARAGERYRREPRHPPPAKLEEAVAAEGALIAASLQAPSTLRPALDAVARLSAWSRPVWRLDGEMLPDLLRTLGIGVVAGRASGLFETAFEARPELAAVAGTLPVRLADFSTAGTWLSSGDVKLLAGALRLQRLSIAKNAAESGENAELAMRHARLLEEAALFCEAEGFGLLEAAGVEWHDRR